MSMWYGRDQFMSEETRENRLIHGKYLLIKLKHKGFRMCWLFSDVKNFKQDQNINLNDSTEIPSFQQLRWFYYAQAIREIPCLLYSSSPLPGDIVEYCEALDRQRTKRKTIKTLQRFISLRQLEYGCAIISIIMFSQTQGIPSHQTKIIQTTFKIDKDDLMQPSKTYSTRFWSRWE